MANAKTREAKFLGDTPGNRNINHNRTEMNQGGSGESHSFSSSGAGGQPTKGNTYLKPDRTSGYAGGKGGGKHKAGG